MSKTFFETRKGISFFPNTVPSDPSNGDMYYDTGINTFRFYLNGGWTNLPASFLTWSSTTNASTYFTGANALGSVALNTTATNKYLQQVSSGAPTFQQVGFADISGQANLTTQVTGILPVANGGTNSSTALNSNRIMVSVSGSIVELAAQTSTQVSYYNGSGLPTGSSTFTFASGSLSLTTANNVNLISSSAIQIGDTTQSASTAGAGALRYHTGALQYSDGTNWDTLATGGMAWQIGGNTLVADSILGGNAGSFSVLLQAGGLNVTKFVYTASAVNYLTNAGSITGSPVTIGAAGTDGNIGISIVPAGSGVVTLGGGNPVITNFSSAGIVHNDASGNLSTSLIVNADVSATAAIAVTKLAALTASSAVVTDGSGFLTASATTATQLGYLSNVTSDVQTQINGKVSKSGDTMTGNLVMSAGATVTGLPNPVGSTDAVNLTYVQSLLNGVVWKTYARVATTGVLSNSPTYNNGSSGVGATLTAGSNGALSIDGITLATNDRVLVKDQTATLQNGIYVVTNTGSAGTAYVLTRSTDANTGALLVAAAVFVDEGVANADHGFLQVTAAPITVGTTGLVWNNNFGTGAYAADGTTLTLTGKTFSISNGGVSDTQVAASAGIQYTKLAALSVNSMVISDGSGYLTTSNGSGFVFLTAGVPSYFSTISLTSQVNGILPVANGGTNSGAALSNNRIMISSGGAVVEHSAQTAAQVSYYNANGLPTGSAAFTFATGTITLTTANQNNIVSSSSIKVGSNSQSASTAGAGSVQWTGSVLQYSDGTAWNTLATGGTAWQIGGNTTGAASIFGSLDNFAVNMQANGKTAVSILPLTGTAANYLTVIGSTATNGPTVGAAGSDTNISLNISPKGSGQVILGGTTAPLVSALGAGFVRSTSGGQLSSSALVASDVNTFAFVNGGNSFGAATSIGTNDAHALNFLTNGAQVMSLSTAGTLQLGTASMFVEFMPLQSFALVDNTASAATVFTMSDGFNFIIVEYSVVRGSTSRMGTLYLSNDGTSAGLADVGDTASDVGATFSATLTGGNVLLQYTTTSTGTDGTMRYAVRRF